MKTGNTDHSPLWRSAWKALLPFFAVWIPGWGIAALVYKPAPAPEQKQEDVAAHIGTAWRELGSVTHKANGAIYEGAVTTNANPHRFRLQKKEGAYELLEVTFAGSDQWVNAQVCRDTPFGSPEYFSGERTRCSEVTLDEDQRFMFTVILRRSQMNLPDFPQ